MSAPDLRLAEVLRLALVEGQSVRAISRGLSMSRRTVRRLLGRAADSRRKAAAPKRVSLLDRFDPELKRLLADTPEMRAPAVLERLRPLGYAGGITILRDHLRGLRPRQPREAFLTLDFKPGAAVQVDWADFGFALPGCPRRVSAFVMALCYSRYLYLEFTVSQSIAALLRCMENGLRFYGGSTVVDIFDNMKTVVLEHSPRHTVFNSRFMEYAQARGFRVLACNVRRGNEKGRVERPIGFLRERFWPGRRFQDLLDLNVQATAWRDTFANNRVHEVTGKVPALVFRHEESALLKPLPQVPFNTDEVESRSVSRTYRVSFDRNHYSVPWRLVGQTVLVRANADAVSVFLGPKQVALHRRCWRAGEDIEHPSHKEGLLERKPRAAADEQLPRALAVLGDTGQSYLQIFAAGSRSIKRESVRLILLVELFGATATADAIDEVMRSGHVGAEYVEYVLRHKRGLTPAAPPLRLGDPELDTLCFKEPDLSVYDRPVKTLDPSQKDLP